MRASVSFLSSTVARGVIKVADKSLGEPIKRLIYEVMALSKRFCRFKI